MRSMTVGLPTSSPLSTKQRREGFTTREDAVTGPLPNTYTDAAFLSYVLFPQSHDTGNPI